MRFGTDQHDDMARMLMKHVKLSFINKEIYNPRKGLRINHDRQAE